ncbi:MAG: undecaprenyl-phosphate glucose phosphotransferase [Sphingomonadaceae bacterium]|nr:undecaprenyl-phosphate glucose phosphotransferase [Sphingomonadaceae bacterium]
MTDLVTAGELTGSADSVGRSALLFETSVLSLRIVEVATLFGVAIGLAALLGINVTGGADYLRASLVAVGFYAVLAELTGAYDVDVRFSVRRAWGRVLTAWLLAAMFLLTLSFLLKVSESYSRLWAFGFIAAGGVAVCGVRTVGVAYLRRLKNQGHFDQRVAIFGAGPQGERLAEYIQGDRRLTIRLVGCYDDRSVERLPPAGGGQPLRGTLSDLVATIRRGAVDQVIVALPWSAETRLQAIVAELAATPIRIRLAPDLASFAFAQRPIVRLGDVPVIALNERPISGFDQLIKRALDVVLGSIALILATPVLIAAAIAIRLDGPGPIFFRQMREGFNNHRFAIWKFRTMRADASEHDAIRQAKRGDDRVTRVGKFLRRTSIDELPQLFNVLDGSMSLVGPRPHAPSTRAGERPFAEVVKSYASRHNVRPGITGWAQVNGWRGETDTEEKLVRRLEHDLFYMERWSVPFDLYILVRTVGAVLFMSKAY